MIINIHRYRKYNKYYYRLYKFNVVWKVVFSNDKEN